MFDRTITPESLIETKGLKRSAVLAALYNAASKVGHGKKDPGSETMTEAEAKAILGMSNGVYAFDYLGGKRLKIDLTDSEAAGIVAGQYDYGQGHGTAKRAIEILRLTGDPCHPDIIALQEKSKAAAKIASAPLRESGTVTEGTLAEALGLTDRSVSVGIGRTGQDYLDAPEAPCITINL